MVNFIRSLIKTDGRIFLLIGFLSLTAYSFMLSSPFKTLDDDFSIVKNQDIRSLKNIPKLFASTYFKSEKDYYRPMVYVTYAVEYHFFGLDYFYYNLDNVLLHILNAFLVFQVVLLLLGGDRLKAFLAALLFAVHPIHWEAVGNVSGRAILLCAFFVFGAAYFFLRFSRERRIWLLIASLACYALGLLSKESAGVFLVVAAAYWLLVSRRSLREVAVSLWPFVGVAGAYLWLRHAMGISKLFPWPSFQDMLLGVASFLNGVLIYFRLFLYPVDLHFDRAQLVYKSFLTPELWLTVLVYAVAFYGLVRFYRRLSGLTIFCVLWFFIELFPVSQIITSIGVYPGAISLAEHFVYVASVPVFILMIGAAGKAYTILVEKKVMSLRTAHFVFLGCFTFFYITLIQQNIYASNEFVMLRDSLQKEPKNSRLQYSMGMVYVKARNYGQAVEHFRNAVAIHACNYSYHLALGQALADGGNLIEAAREFETIPPREDINGLLDGNKAGVYRLLAADYEKKVVVSPSDPELQFALGLFYSKLSRPEKALELYRQALTLKPDHYDALFNLAATSEQLGDLVGAREAYGKLVATGDPKNTFRERSSDRLKALGSVKPRP